MRDRKAVASASDERGRALDGMRLSIVTWTMSSLGSNVTTKLPRVRETAVSMRDPLLIKVARHAGTCGATPA